MNHADSGIIRVEHDSGHPYKVLNTAFAADSRLSFAARGVLVYLLSKPNDWRMMVPDLIKQSSAGRDAVYAILKNLEECGYLRRIRSRRKDGTFEHTTVVYETAQPLPDNPDPDEGEQKPAFSLPVEPLPDSPLAAKPDIYRIGKVPTREKLIKDTHHHTAAPVFTLVPGGDGGDVFNEKENEGETDLESDDAMIDDCEIETDEAQRAELVDQLVAAGLWRSRAVQAVAAGTVATDRDLVCCKRYLASSTAHVPGALLWSDWLSDGRVPPLPGSDTSTVSSAQIAAARRLLEESERRQPAEGETVNYRAYAAALAHGGLKAMPRLDGLGR